MHRRSAYNGYGSCPLTVERGKIVLAEFGYGGKLLPSFPRWVIDGQKPSRLAWYPEGKILPPIYWKAMLKRAGVDGDRSRPKQGDARLSDLNWSDYPERWPGRAVTTAVCQRYAGRDDRHHHADPQSLAYALLAGLPAE